MVMVKCSQPGHTGSVPRGSNRPTLQSIVSTGRAEICEIVTALSRGSRWCWKTEFYTGQGGLNAHSAFHFSSEPVRLFGTLGSFNESSDHHIRAYGSNCNPVGSWNEFEKITVILGNRYRG